MNLLWNASERKKGNCVTEHYNLKCLKTVGIKVTNILWYPVINCFIAHKCVLNIKTFIWGTHLLYIFL